MTSRSPCGLVSAVLLGVLYGPGCYTEWADDQPLAFNHAKHKEKGLNCEICHPGARRWDRATIAGIAVCGMCHGSPRGNTATERRVVDAVARGENIPWRIHYYLPDYVRYSHRTHVRWGRIECPTCHGDVGDASVPVIGPAERTLDMDTCMDCHEARGVTNDCAACHR